MNTYVGSCDAQLCDDNYSGEHHDLTKMEVYVIREYKYNTKYRR